ncbi:MAG: hypothetical protein ACOZBH_01870 [Patescibacteria group bacterium]
MTIKIRRIIASIFIIGFMISAPILILYTAGYRYNFKKNELKKTGALFIETEPKSTQIFLNGTLEKTDTPAHITNIFPNKYLIEAKRDGYKSWQKELEIRSQSTTFAENIVLFKDASPVALAGGDIAATRAAAKCVLAETDDAQKTNYACFDLSSGQLTPIASFDGRTRIIDASPKLQKFLLLDEAGQYQIIASDNSYRQTLPALAIDPEIIKWGDENEHFIYFSNAHQLWQINLLGQSPVFEKIIDDQTIDIIDFAVFGDRLYTIVDNEAGANLNLSAIQNPDKIIEQIKLPSAKFSIDSFVNDSLIIIDHKTDSLYVISRDIDETKIKIDGCDRYSFLAEDKLMAVYNDFEIFTLSLKADVPQADLIVRYSTPIEKIQWLNNNYLAVLHENKLKMIELDNREKHNVWQLTPDDLKIDDFFFDNDKKNVFLLADEKLWKLDIR